MSLTILETVKEFLIRLVKDEDFRTQLISDKVEDIRKVMADSGYNFSQDEFETAAIEILELKELGHFEELTEEELVGAVGGWRSDWYYKYLRDPKPRPKPLPKPIDPQPLYGVVIDPPIQAMYGVVVSDDI